MLPEEVSLRSRALTGNLEKVLAVIRPATLGAYWPFKGEFDPRAVLSHLHAQGTRLALPRVIQRNEPLAFFAWKPGDVLATGPYGIPEPASEVRLRPQALVIPMVAFDEEGYRLGYGGGYYDRTLSAELPAAVRIGVSFEAAKLPSIHPQPFDEPMDLVVTESSVYASRATGFAPLSLDELARELPEVAARAACRGGR